jgi:hypothetical protein
MNDAKTPEAKTQVDPEARVELLEFRQGILGLVSELLRLAGDYAEREGYTDCRVANSPNGYLITAKRKTDKVDKDVHCPVCDMKFCHDVGGTWFQGKWFCGTNHLSIYSISNADAH